MTIYYLGKRNLKKMLKPISQQRLVDVAVDSLVDMMAQKFSRRDSKLRTFELEVETIHFRIFKNRGYFF